MPGSPRVEAGAGKPCEVDFDLGVVEVRPPSHGGARGPVVDSQPERVAPSGSRESAGIGSFDPSLQVAFHGAAIDGQVLVNHPVDVEAMLDRSTHRYPVQCG